MPPSVCMIMQQRAHQTDQTNVHRNCFLHPTVRRTGRPMLHFIWDDLLVLDLQPGSSQKEKFIIILSMSDMPIMCEPGVVNIRLTHEGYWPFQRQPFHFDSLSCRRQDVPHYLLCWTPLRAFPYSSYPRLQSVRPALTAATETLTTNITPWPQHHLWSGTPSGNPALLQHPPSCSSGETKVEMLERLY